MESLAAEEQLAAAVTSSLPWMEEEDRQSVLDDLQRAARGGRPPERAGETWGGGYRDSVAPVSAGDFREEIRRGVNG